MDPRDLWTSCPSPDAATAATTPGSPLSILLLTAIILTHTAAGGKTILTLSGHATQNGTEHGVPSPTSAVTTAINPIATATDTANVDISATDTANVDISANDTANVDLSATDTANADLSANANDTANVDLSVNDSANVDLSASDTTNVEISANDTANVDISASDTANVDPSATADTANVDLSINVSVDLSPTANVDLSTNANVDLSTNATVDLSINASADLSTNSNDTASETDLDEDSMFPEWLQAFLSIGHRSSQNSMYTLDLIEKPPHSASLFFVAIAVLGVPGCIGNALLILMSRQTEIRPHSYSVYLVATSLFDTVALFCHYVEMFLWVTPLYKDDWIQYQNVQICRFATLLFRVGSSVSPWIHVAFSVDRYIAVLYPLKRKLLCTIRTAYIVCAVILLLCFLTHLPFVLMTQMLPFQGAYICANQGSQIGAAIIAETTLNTMVPCMCLLFINLHTLITVQSGMKERASLTTTGASQAGVVERGGGREGAKKSEDQQTVSRNMTRALLTIPIVSFVCSVPYAFVFYYLQYSLAQMRQKTEMDRMLMLVEPYVRVFYTVGFTANFYVLMATSKAYRAIARKMLRLSCK